MTDKRSLHFTSQGFRSQEIVIAPDIGDFDSKRRPLIVNEDKILDFNISELDIGTKARNKAFQERLDEVWHSTEGWESHLKTEAKEAVETILNMKEDYQVFINNLTASLSQEIDSIFDKFDLELVPQEICRMENSAKDVQFFFQDTVPATIEKQSGEVSRQLRRTYETFDIEKKKEFKRETKLVEKASKHLQSTAQRFEDENALLSSCFFGLEDDVVELERHAARMHLMRNAAAISHTASLNRVVDEETTVRGLEDEDVLDTVIETQRLLQQTVLMHFGANAEEDLPTMDKLNRRMSKILDKASAAESTATTELHTADEKDDVMATSTAKKDTNKPPVRK